MVHVREKEFSSLILCCLKIIVAYWPSDSQARHRRSDDTVNGTTRIEIVRDLFNILDNDLWRRLAVAPPLLEQRSSYGKIIDEETTLTLRTTDQLMIYKAVDDYFTMYKEH